MHKNDLENKVHDVENKFRRTCLKCIFPSITKLLAIWFVLGVCMSYVQIYNEFIHKMDVSQYHIFYNLTFFSSFDENQGNFNHNESILSHGVILTNELYIPLRIIYALNN